MKTKTQTNDTPDNQTASYDSGAGTKYYTVKRVIRETSKRKCVLLHRWESFGRDGGYARSWGAKEQRSDFLFWTDLSDENPAQTYVSSILAEIG